MSQQNSKQSGWMNIWTKRGLFSALLWPFSLLFRLVVVFRRYAYKNNWFKSFRLPVPVVIVGNVFVGGTGKTPLVIWLVGILRKAGFTPGVISRGYGTSNVDPVLVTDHSKSDQAGDEPLLIVSQTGCPLVVCRKRVKAAEFLLNRHPEVDIIISDDGMQHYALARNVEIMLFDGRGSGNGWMLPAGPLREPVSRRRDFTVINGNNSPAPGNPIYVDDMFLMRMVTDRAEQLKDRTHVKKLQEIQTGSSGEMLKTVAAAGIGNPSRFFASLRMARLNFTELPLPDHFAFTSNPFGTLDADIILITEKDAVKCAQIEEIVSDDRIWVVPARVEIDNNDELERRIVEKCRECRFA